MKEALLRILAWIIVIVIGGGLTVGIVYVAIKEWSLVLILLGSTLVGIALLWSVAYLVGAFK